MSSSHPKRGHWHAAARTKYAQSNQNMSKQIFDMFPRFFLELRRSKKELELREPQLQPELQPASSSSRKRPSSAEEPAAKRRLRAVSTYGLPARVRCLDLKTEQVDTI